MLHKSKWVRIEYGPRPDFHDAAEPALARVALLDAELYMVPGILFRSLEGECPHATDSPSAVQMQLQFQVSGRGLHEATSHEDGNP
jgi:hypothetical protein